MNCFTEAAESSITRKAVWGNRAWMELGEPSQVSRMKKDEELCKGVKLCEDQGTRSRMKAFVYFGVEGGSARVLGPGHM